MWILFEQPKSYDNNTTQTNCLTIKSNELIPHSYNKQDALHLFANNHFQDVNFMMSNVSSTVEYVFIKKYPIIS
jgi:hypothetical protein